MGEGDNEPNKEQLAAEMVDVKTLLAELVRSNTALSQALLSKQQSESSTSSSNELSIASINAIEARIQEFNYSPEDGATFERWWNRHEDIFTLDLNGWEDVKKIRLLIRHVSTSVERTFVESIAPTKWIELTLDQVKDQMLKLFGDNTSIFDRRRTMLDLKMSKENIEDVRTLAARVNSIVENAQVKDATIDDWKVLTFLHALDLPRYSDVHLKMMQTAKQKGKGCTLDDLISVYNDLSQLKKDSRGFTEPNREVYAVHWRDRSQDVDDHGMQKDGSTACYRCGSEEHQRSTCPFQSAKCHNCGNKGHIAKVCMKKAKNLLMVTVANGAPSSFSIRVKINGQATSMVIDTGADITIISKHSWEQLGRPAYTQAGCTVKCANGEDLRLKGRFTARMEYCGIEATGDVYVTHSRLNVLGKNFIKQLDLIKVRGPDDEKHGLVQAATPERTVIEKVTTPLSINKKTGSKINEGAAPISTSTKGLVQAATPVRTVKIEGLDQKEEGRKGRRRHRIDTVTVNAAKQYGFSIDVKLNGVNVAMDVDTGSDITFISKEVWRTIGAPDLVSSNCEAVCASGTQLEIVGMFIRNLEYGDVGATAEIHVAATNRNIIGRDIIDKLNLLEWRTIVTSTSNKDENNLVKKEIVKEDATVPIYEG